MGDLDLRVEACNLSGFDRDLTQSFETDCGRSDIVFRFHPIHPVKTADIGREIAAVKDRGFLCFNGHWDSPFLSVPEVGARLLDPRLSPEGVSLEMLDETLRILDFNRGEQDIFHFPEMSAGVQFSLRGEFFLAPFLAVFRAIILHSSCVVRNGRAAVFMGSDGVGKTTVAESSLSGDILCDDQVILRRSGDEYAAYGTLWGRTFQAGGRAPVGALFILEQSDRFSLARLDPKAVLRYIWVDYPQYRLPLPRKMRPSAFDLVCDLCMRIPAYLMRFGRKKIDWEAIDRALVKR